jgi:hypothetical protein
VIGANEQPFRDEPLYERNALVVAETAGHARYRKFVGLRDVFERLAHAWWHRHAV